MPRLGQIIGKYRKWTPEQKLEAIEKVFATMAEGYTVIGACGVHGFGSDRFYLWVKEVADAFSGGDDEVRKSNLRDLKRALGDAASARLAFLEGRALKSRDKVEMTNLIFARKCAGVAVWTEAKHHHITFEDATDDDDGDDGITLELVRAQDATESDGEAPPEPDQDGGVG